MKIIKNDGKIEQYDYNKILKGIYYAAKQVGVNINENNAINSLLEEIEEDILLLSFSDSNAEIEDIDGIISSEEIYESVTKALINFNKDVFVSFIEYESERRKERIKNTDLIKTVNKFGISTDKDNANVGSNFSGKLLRIASETNKIVNISNMPERFSKAHETGSLYFHDLDSFNLTINCLHIPTGEVLRRGFNTGYGQINPPKRIESAAELSCILLQSSQNDMFGGQSHPNFDNDMAHFVKVTRKEIIEELLEDLSEFDIGSADNTVFRARVEKILNRRIHQAMQMVIFNLNSMHSRAGSQVPFSSVNIGLPLSKDAALVCQIFLEEYEKGLGKGEQPVFPNIIFRVKDGVNKKKTDPYYYLYRLACRVTSKRMNPTFMNIDADFNKDYYDKGYLPATMGCVDGQEIITYKIEDLLYVESFSRMWDRLKKNNIIKEQKDRTSFYMEVDNVKIYDTKKGFVKVNTIIKNSDKGNWTRVKFSNGRVLTATEDHPLPIINKGRKLVSELKIGDEIEINTSQYAEETFVEDREVAWLYGFVICDGSYDTSLVVSIAEETENDIEEHYKNVAHKFFNYEIETKVQHRGQRGNYKDIIARGKTKQTRKHLEKFYGGLQKIYRQIPPVVFSWNIEARKSFLAGMIDADGYITKNKNSSSAVQLGSTNKELALQTMALAQSVGYFARIYLNKYSSKTDKIRYRVEFYPDVSFINEYVISEKKRNGYKERFFDEDKSTRAKVVSVEKLGFRNEYSYDVETESDHFEVTGIYSHNCRTYLMSNVNGEAGCEGRGNIAPVTINLPRIALESNGNLGTFFRIFDERIELAKDSLLYRYEILKKLKVKDLPFVAGENIIKGSEGLGQLDSIEPILKQGTWGIGFIGLAEALTSLLGFHHGENERAKEIGELIISHLRSMTDKYTEKYKLNFSCYATPAEGLSGRFIKQDKKLFGEIKGVTDKDYYTNSFHIPVSFKISIKDKINIEAPYHKMCNGGHISYIEVDSTPNEDITMKILEYAYNNTNINYLGINFHIRYCKKCGTNLTNNQSCCPKCKSTEIQGISRVTGYLALDDRFGEGKAAEKKDRLSLNSNTNGY